MGQLKRIGQLEADVKKLKLSIKLIGEAVDKLDIKESVWQKLIKNITQKTTKSEKTS